MMKAHHRRGNYAAVFGFTLPVLLGVTALAFDISMLRLADSQAQDIADAAAHGALIAFRGTGDIATGQAAAVEMVTVNTIIGGPPSLDAVDFGVWDGAAFAPTLVSPNAVQVAVSRDVPFAIAPFLGFQSQLVGRSATAAARPVHIVLVIDITNSWNQGDFDFAREASLQFFDSIVDSHGPDDRIGMVVFTGRYGVEHTPLLLIDDAVAASHRDIWADLGTASKAGTPAANPKGCDVYGGAQLNDFSAPIDGCFPQMWREYIDESGTDHSVGIEMATAMFEEQVDPSAYRAAIILTDGNPNGVGAHVQRAAAGYDELRWRFIQTPVARDTAQVIADTELIADSAWASSGVHTWAVSFVANAVWMDDVVQGDGYYTQTNNAAALVPIFRDIAESLPVALVE